jgi:hypothetical protein
MTAHYPASALLRGRATVAAAALCVLAACGERPAASQDAFTDMMVQLHELGVEAAGLERSLADSAGASENLDRRREALEARTRNLETRLAPFIASVLPGKDSNYGELDWSVDVEPGAALFTAAKRPAQGEIVFEGSIVRLPRLTSSKVAEYPRRCGSYPAKWVSGPSNTVCHVLVGQTELTMRTSEPRYMPPGSFEWVVRAFDLETLSKL